MKHLSNVIDILLGCNVRRATKYVSPTQVIVAHRIVYRGNIKKNGELAKGGDRSINIRLKIGPPNYHERDFIKDCIKADVPFPVRKVQLAHFRPRPPTYRQLRTIAKQKRAAARRARQSALDGGRAAR